MSLAMKRAALSEKAALLKTKGGRLKDLADKETLTAEELVELKTLTGEVTGLRAENDALVAEIKELEEAIAAADFSVPASTLTGENKRKSPVKVKSTDGMLKVGIVVAGMAAAKAGQFDSVEEALEESGFGQIAEELGSRRKQLQATGGSGGLLVPPSMSADVIEFLRPQTAFLQLQPRKVPMPNGTFTQVGGNTGASASYGQENSVPAYSEATFRDINMSAKELQAKTAISNHLLSLGLPGIREFVETDLREACAETMDLNMFLGDGLASRPQGIYNIPGIGTKSASGATTPTIAEIDADLRWAINYLGSRNVPMASAKWTMSLQTAGWIEDRRDGNGNFAYPTMQGERKTLKGFPVLITTNLPTNLGGNGDGSHISLVASNQVYFGEQPGLQVKVSTEATYTDASGQLRSAAERNETVMFMFMHHDVGLRHLAAIALLDTVRWGR